MYGTGASFLNNLLDMIKNLLYFGGGGGGCYTENETVIIIYGLSTKLFESCGKSFV